MRTLLVAVLFLHSLPALALAVSAEVPISPVELTSSRLAYDPHIATNGETYVAVWTDYRSTPGATYAARVRADGVLLDRVGIRVAPRSQAGAVIWSGRAFLIAYLQEGMVKVRALSPDGLLGEPIDLFGNYVLANVYKMRMATNGDSVLLVTSDATAALLGPEGHERRQISFPWLWAQNGFGVAAAGSNYLVAAGTHDKLLKTQLVTRDGDFAAAHTLMTGVNYGADVASDGSRFFVTWTRGNVHAQFLSHDGAPVEPQLQLTSIEPAYFYSHHVIRLVRRTDDYVLLYRTYGAAPFDTMRLGNDGENRGALPTSFSGPIEDLAFTNGHGGAVGYESGRLSAAFFDPTAPLRSATPVALAGKRQKNVRLARVPGGFVSAWQANVLDAELWLSRGPGSTPVLVAASDGKLIDVVVEGGAVWVVWREQEKLYARRFTLALEAIDAEPVLLATIDSWDQEPDLAVAAGGGVVAIVYTWPHDDAHVEAYLARPAANGIDVQKVAVASEPNRDRVPGIVWDGSAFVIAWANATGWYISGGISTNDRTSVYKPDDRILAMRMSASGALLDASPVEVARSKHAEALAVANGARGAAIAWQTYQTPDLATSRRRTYAALAVSNAAVADLGGEDTFFGAFAANDRGGFLLTRAAPLDNTMLHPEVLELDAGLSVASSAKLSPLTLDVFSPTLWQYQSPYDADLIAGTLAYARIAAGSYGHVHRVFTRRIHDTPRRRAVR